MNTSRKIIITKLQEIVKSETNTIKSFVAEEILAYHKENIQKFFIKIFNDRVVLSSLLCEGASDEFFALYHQEINQIKQDYEASHSEPLVCEGDYKYILSWFAYKITAIDLAKELGLAK